MLPGEEFAVERWYRLLPSSVEARGRALERLSAMGRWLAPPSSDGAAWWADPQMVNAILLVVITVLLAYWPADR